MSTLRENQLRFRNLVCNEQAVTPADALWLKDTPPADLETRVGVYQYAYFARLTESLADDFMEVQEVLGEDAFEALAKDYIRAHPSTETSIGPLSEGFPQYVPAELAPLAKREWQEMLSLLAPDVASNLEALAGVSPEQIGRVVFQLHPSVRVLDASEKGPVVLCSARGEVQSKPLSTTQVALLRQIQAGSCLQELFAWAEANGVSEAGAGAWFQEWSQDRILNRFVLPTP